MCAPGSGRRRRVSTVLTEVDTRVLGHAARGMGAGVAVVPNDALDRGRPNVAAVGFNRG